MRSVLVDALRPYLGAELAGILAPTWFTMVSLAWIIGTMVALRIARARGLPPSDILRALLVGYLGGLTAGIAGPVLVDVMAQLAAGQLPRLRWAGMTSWYGIVGALAGIAWSLRARATSTLAALDCFAIPAGVALCIGRLGCFIAGCDFGLVSSGPWAMRFPVGSPAWSAHVDAGWMPASRGASLPVHPTQLYEAALGLVIVVVLLLAARRQQRLRPGQEFVLAAVLYLIGRFAVEALRGDLGRGIYAGLSTGQWMSLVILLGLGIYYLRGYATSGRLAVVVTLLLAFHSSALRAEPERTFDLSALVTSSTSLNRPEGQVPQLGGFTLSGNFALEQELSVGVDLESLANTVAVHRGLYLCAQIRRNIGPKIDLGLRGGLGMTFVDFSDPAFGEVVAATGARATATLDYWLREDWAITLWPATIEYMGNRDLGGSIVSYQVRLGVTWGPRRSAQSTPVGPVQIPVQPQPTQPAQPAQPQPAPIPGDTAPLPPL